VKTNTLATLAAVVAQSLASSKRATKIEEPASIVSTVKVLIPYMNVNPHFPDV